MFPLEARLLICLTKEMKETKHSCEEPTKRGRVDCQKKPVIQEAKSPGLQI
jgi:hypothetical protein